MTAEIVVPIALQSLRLDLGGLDQLAADGDAVADDLGEIRRRTGRDGEADRGEALLHLIDLQYLADLAPTMLALMELPQPKEMTGTSLLRKS